MSNDVESSEKDLLLDLSDSTQHLVDTQALPIDVLSVRDVVSDLDISKLDEYGDSLLYSAYYAAKKCKTISPSVIARNLKISKNLYEYYLDKYPKFKAVIELGFIDAKEEMKETIVSALYKAAQGYSITETGTVTQTEYDSEGVARGSIEKVTTVQKQVQPNVTAGIELMKRLDPSWVPQLNVDVSGNIDHLHLSAKDIDVAVDYRKLSPQALKELLSSHKDTSPNMQLLKSAEKPTIIKPDSVEVVSEQPVKRKRGRPRKTVAQNAIETTQKEETKMRKQAKKEVGKQLNNKL